MISCHGASLRRSELRSVRLQNANLKGADLTGAHLSDARLAGAIYDQRTRWPRGFDPARHLANERALARKPPPWQRLLRQRRRLPDGCLLTLEAVTYEKEHHWPPMEWMENVAHADLVSDELLDVIASGDGLPDHDQKLPA